MSEDTQRNTEEDTLEEDNRQQQQQTPEQQEKQEAEDEHSNRQRPSSSQPEQQKKQQKPEEDQQARQPLPPPHHTSKYRLIYDLRKGLDSDDAMDYAEFLQSRERMCCPDGYVDSSKLIYQYQLHSPNFSVNQGGGVGGASVDTARGSADKAAEPGTTRGASRAAGSGAATLRGVPANSSTSTTSSQQSKVIALSMNRERFEREYLAKLKKTEELIGQSKQRERVAKRREGDILKDQREIRVARREFAKENDRKQQQENQHLNKSMERYTEIKRDHQHQRATLVHQRMHEALQEREEDLNSGRKAMNRSLSLARQYRAKLDSLKLKRLEVDRLMADYEKRLRLKREQEEELMRQLRQLGDGLGMEKIKGQEMTLQQLQQRRLEERNRVQQDYQQEKSVDERLTHGSEDQKDSVMRQRRLSAQLSNRNERLDAKKRQDDRALIDTRTALTEEQREQRRLARELRLVDTDRRAAQSDQRVGEARKRRQQQQRRNPRRGKDAADADAKSGDDQEAEEEAAYAERARQRAAAAQRADYDEALRHFQRIVSKLEDEEAALYHRVRASEASRQDEEQQVRRLQAQLLRARGQGHSESLERLAAQNREARRLEAELLRHRSRLDSLTAEREEAYYRLEAKRQELTRDRDTLERERQERDRMVSIGGEA